MALYISFQSTEKEKEATTSEINKQEAEVELNVFSASLCLGDELNFGDRRIKFREIISDSRCPSNPIVMCFWAGQVRVKVDVYEKRELVGSVEFLDLWISGFIYCGFFFVDLLFVFSRGVFIFSFFDLWSVRSSNLRLCVC